MKRTKPTDERKLTLLVRELIGGKPVDQVPADQMSAVTAALEEARAREGKHANGMRIRKINRLLADLGNLEMKKPRTSRPRSQADDREAVTPPAVLDSVLADLVGGFSLDIAETQMIPLLVERAKQTITDLLAAGDYYKAQSYENVHQALVDILLVRKAQDEKRNRMMVVEDQLAGFRAGLEEATEKFHVAMEHHEDSVALLIEEEVAEFDKVVDKIDELERGNLPPNFRKFSAELLNLREREKFLIHTRRYLDAAGLKEEADAMEERELIELRRQFVEAQETKNSLQRAKHEQKLQCIKEKGDRESRELQTSMDRELDNRRRAIEILEQKLVALDAGLPDAPVPVPRKEKEKRADLFVTQGRLDSARGKTSAAKRNQENSLSNVKPNAKNPARVVRRA
jgi:hypothetical protein